MRIRFAAACVAAAVLSAAGAAQAQTAGYVGANYEYMHVGGFDAWGATYRAEGAAAFRAGLIGGQIDAGGTYYGEDVGNYGGTVHLNLHGDVGLVGGFAGFYNNGSSTFWGGGLEGQANFGQASLYGQVGWGRTDILPGVDFWAGKLQGNYYVTDDVRLSAYGGYTRGHQSGVGRLDFWNAGAEAEYKFADVPLAIVAGYEHGKLRHSNLDTDVFKLGVRYSFGGSLKARDQTGGTLGSAADLFGGDAAQFLVSFDDE